MNAADFDELSEEEKSHFYECQQCGEMVDMRQLDDVLFQIMSTGRIFNMEDPKNFELCYRQDEYACAICCAKLPFV